MNYSLKLMDYMICQNCNTYEKPKCINCKNPRDHTKRKSTCNYFHWKSGSRPRGRFIVKE